MGDADAGVGELDLDAPAASPSETVSFPPSGMASKAFIMRFQKTCWILFLSSLTGGRSGSRSRTIRMFWTHGLVFEELGGPLDQLVDAGEYRLGRGLAGELEQAAGRFGAARGLVGDEGQVFAEGGSPVAARASDGC